MSDYKDTLNLPKTKFPMKANLPNKEPEILKKWQDTNLYNKIRDKYSNSPRFLLHDGPPYANGNIHIGHALNKTLKDIVVKSQTLSGFDAPFKPGWDCHGLPIELKVEKKLGKPGVKVEKDVFRKACRDYAHEQIAAQRNDFIRLGVFGDWDNPYLSMDYKIEADTVRALAKIVSRGYIKKGDKPVHWCFDCQSSLAEAEVEYNNKTSHSIDVKFKIDAPEKLPVDLSKNNIPVSVVIWTTTPWSLTSNQAVALNPDFSYSFIKINNNEIIIVASQLIDSLLEKWEIENHEIIDQVHADKLENLKVKHPLENRLVPIILSDHVTLDAGTGAVHIAPSHGLDDYNICNKYKLPVLNTVGANGCYIQDVPNFAGMHVFKASEAILGLLNDKNCLLNVSKLEHSYPHCWRHKTPVVYRATPQWFINLEHNNLRERAIKIVRSNRWIPNWGMQRMETMLQGRPDWCISRQQRVWGVPMAFVVNQDTGDLHPDCVSIMNKVADLIEQDGLDAWYRVELNELIKQDECENYTKSYDTLDVWFSSGVTHECVISRDPALGFPADLYLEGSDQHRGWFQSSLITSVALHDDSPYKEVLTHGYTVDADGRKMSKSLGNVVSPDKVIKTMGADILRLWVAATDYQKDMSISDEILKRISEAYRRIRNTFRYLLSNLYDFDYKSHSLSFDSLIELDKYILYKTNNLQLTVQQDYENYNLHHIYQKIHNFCAVDLGGFYLDIIKDRQYTCKKDSMSRRSCQTAIYHIANTMVRLVAPILSFTAEEMWSHMQNEQESVFMTTWYREIKNIKLDSEKVKFWDLVINVRNECNKALESSRNQGIIGAALEAEITLYCSDEILQKLIRIQKELHFIMITSRVYLLPIANEGVETDIPGLRIKVTSLDEKKCVRCWHRSGDVGSNSEHQDICLRCIDNVYNDGENRLFA